MRSTDDAEADDLVEPPQQCDASVRVTDDLISNQLMPHRGRSRGEERQANQSGRSGATDRYLQGGAESADDQQPAEDDNDGDNAPDFDRDS
jgi:hypothetical protein